MHGWAGTLLTLFAILMITSAGKAATATPATLQNPYATLTIDSVQLVGLNVDPSGQAGFSSRSFAKSLKPEFWETSPDTKVHIDGNTATITGLAVWDNYRLASAGRTDDPARLEPGQTLAQSFTVPPDVQFDTVTVKLPTWNTSTSGATISLYRGTELIAQRGMTNVEDNSWQPIKSPTTCGPGDYEVRLTDPVGTIGWWSGSERAFSVNATRSIGRGTLIYCLDGSTIRVRAEVATKLDFKSLPWRWRTTWTQSGYDCTPKSGTLFSRFYTDNQRYMCVEQLKRRNNAGLQFDACKWIEMDGTADADLLLEGSGLHLHWEMSPREMSLRFDSPIKQDGETLVSEWSLTIKPRKDDVPDIFPRFICSDRAMEADLNRLWWDRGFSYPSPGSGSIEWAEWAALQWTWMGGDPRAAGMRMVSNYPMTDEGYVHTWGATIGWPLVKDRDTRHFDTNARYILASWRHYLWSGDIDFLQGQSDRLRKAMKYQLEVLKGNEGLIVTPEIKTGRHEDLTNNYWDILPFGHLDAYANAYFYGSLSAMEQIESALGTTPLTDYAALREKAHRRYDEVFWDEKEGRYIGCVDIDGVRHDYGFTFVNLEALYYGLGDAAKAARIYHWLETGTSSTGEADIYSKWIFAPRATTIHNPMWGPDAPESEKSDSTPLVLSAEGEGRDSSPLVLSAERIEGRRPPWWTYWWKGTPFGDQCQDGGAILYTSFYDLMDRSRHKGADDAWRRFGEIIDRYRMPDRLCGGTPLYRGENPQQEAAGAVGVDLPFPESGLVPCYYLYGVIGVEPTPDGLRIRPNLPISLDYAGVRGLDWRGAKLNIRATAMSVEIDGVNAEGKPYKATHGISPGGSVLFTGAP